MADRWWDCTHDGIGVPGCPTCDGRFPGPRAVKSVYATADVLLLDDARGWLREARDEIVQLRAEVASLRATTRPEPAALPPHVTNDADTPPEGWEPSRRWTDGPGPRWWLRVARGSVLVTPSDNGAGFLWSLPSCYLDDVVHRAPDLRTAQYRAERELARLGGEVPR